MTVQELKEKIDKAFAMQAEIFENVANGKYTKKEMVEIVECVRTNLNNQRAQQAIKLIDGLIKSGKIEK